MEENDMASKKFTEDEMKHLRESSYVLEVSPNLVHFSVEFKTKFWNSMLDGKTPFEAVALLGINPDMLGKNRVNGLKTMIRNEFRSGKGFRDIETAPPPFGSYSNPETKIKYLEQQIAYKDQEIEFLKKNVSLGREEAAT
jgi:hypothetical protein